jgi:hypothetical protein
VKLHAKITFCNLHLRSTNRKKIRILVGNLCERKVKMPKRTQKQTIEDEMYYDALGRLSKAPRADKQTVRKIERKLDWDLYEVGLQYTC